MDPFKKCSVHTLARVGTRKHISRLSTRRCGIYFKLSGLRIVHEKNLKNHKKYLQSIYTQRQNNS